MASKCVLERRTSRSRSELDVWYSSGYVQDEWRPRLDLTVTAGLRFDVSAFENTASKNDKADALMFRDRVESGAYHDRRMPDEEGPEVAARSDELGRWRREEAHAGARKRPVHGSATLCVDLESTGQHGRAHRRNQLLPAECDPERPFTRSARIRLATSRPTSPGRAPPASS